MIAEKQHSPRSSDVDAIRHEAIRMRLLSQEWAGDSLTELTQALVKLNTLPPSLSHQQYETYLSLILANLDKFTAAAHAASSFTNVIEEERKQISLHVAKANQAILEEQKQVQHLTQQLEREKRHVDRRAQYDALAKLILEHPSCDKSQKELQDAQNDAATVTAQIQSLEQTKDTVRKELLLLAHCTSELGETVQNLSSMISDQHKRPAHTPEPMDTSL